MSVDDPPSRGRVRFQCCASAIWTAIFVFDAIRHSYDVGTVVEFVLMVLQTKWWLNSERQRRDLDWKKHLRD